MKRLIRWVVYLFLFLIVLAVAAVLLMDTIVKELVVSRLRAATGLDTRIEHIDVGLLSPTITIENLKLYNTANFGGSVFIDMPELHMEYDPFAFRSGNLHFKLVRLNLAEVSLVQDKKGRSNVQDLAKKGHAPSGGKKSSSSVGVKFTGIDILNLTLGKFRLANLATGRTEEIDFGIRDQILRNVKSEADLAGINILLAARASMASSASNSPLDLTSLLQSLTSP